MSSTRHFHIDMPDINGTTLAELIYRQDPYAAILFYIGHVEYATEGSLYWEATEDSFLSRAVVQVEESL